MARRFRPLDIEALTTVPPGCSACAFWETAEALPEICGARCDEEALRAWVRHLQSTWGPPGRVVVEDGEALGMIKYAPSRLVPQAQNMAAGPPDPEAVLICCMHIIPEARRRGLGKVLLQSAFRDLAQRSVRTVQAYATTHRGDYHDSPVVGVEFLLRSGFRVARPHPTTPLLEVDIRSAVQWIDNLEAALESLRIPLRVPRRTPVTNAMGG